MAKIYIRFNIQKLVKLRKQVDVIKRALQQMESKMSDSVKAGLLNELGAANTAADEISSDLDSLLALVSTGNPDGLTAAEAEEVRVALAELRTKLTGSAGKFPVQP